MSPPRCFQRLAMHAQSTLLNSGCAFVLNAKGCRAEHKLDLARRRSAQAGVSRAQSERRWCRRSTTTAMSSSNSSVIIEYLDEVVPERRASRRAIRSSARQMRSLMRFIDEMPAAAVRVPTFNLAFLPRFAGDERGRISWRLRSPKPLRKEFMLAMGRTGFPQKEMDGAMGRLRRTYERMDEAIAGERRAVASRQGHHARRRLGDAGDRADGGPGARQRLGRPAARRPAGTRLIRAQPAFKPTYYPGIC